MDTTPLLRDIDDPEAALGHMRLYLKLWADELTKQAEANGVDLGPATIAVRKQILMILRDLHERTFRLNEERKLKLPQYPQEKGIRWPDEYT